MITFKSKYNVIYDEETLSNAVEWYAKLKGIPTHGTYSIYLNSGYPCIQFEGRNIPIGRLLIMYQLRRELTWKELVHHRDENRLNNLVTNLVLTNHFSHYWKYHRTVYYYK